MAFNNEGAAEKMLELFIYNHMKKINVHDVAEIFAKEANIETSLMVANEENQLKEWWGLFWSAFCSRLLNNAGVNGQSSGQMPFGQEWDQEKKLAMKNEGDAQKMLELYIYDHMKKKNLHDIANIFAKEANVETSQLVDIEENLLYEWWEVYWPTFNSRARVNAQSSGQAMLASMENQGAGVNLQPNVLPEFSTAGGNTGEDNRRSQMPLIGGEDSDGLNPVSSRTHATAFYFVLMVLYIVTET